MQFCKSDSKELNMLINQYYILFFNYLYFVGVCKLKEIVINYSNIEDSMDFEERKNKRIFWYKNERME